MPHYHLNLFNDADLNDEEGKDFADLASAKDEAVKSARELMAEHVMAGKPVNLDDRIEIADGSGKTLATIAFRELITIRDGKAASD